MEFRFVPFENYSTSAVEPKAFYTLMMQRIYKGDLSKSMIYSHLIIVFVAYINVYMGILS